MAPITSESSESPIPESELECSAEARVSKTPSPRLFPMPADKILFPRRMIYIEAVLYLLIAAASFGMGYLIGHGGTYRPVAKEATEAVADKRVPIEGKVMLAPLSGDKTPDAGAVVIVLPDDLDKPLSPVGCRVDDTDAREIDSAANTIKALNGAMTRTSNNGGFSVVVPKPGMYHILIISKHLAREQSGALEEQGLREISKYFDPPADVLKDRRWKWIQRKVQSGMEPIPIDFITSA